MIIQYFIGTPDEEIEAVRAKLREWGFQRASPPPFGHPLSIKMERGKSVVFTTI